MGSPTLNHHQPRRFGRVVCIGFRRWKAYSLRPLLLAALSSNVHFAPTASAASRLRLAPTDAIAVWGRSRIPGAEALANTTGCALLRLEDGFYRSIGLGSDLIAPRSLVVDSRGIYFDPTHPSDLEVLLNERDVSPDDLVRARQIRAIITEHQLTKYNIEPLTPAQWGAHGRRIILVPGQVSDDASVRYGSPEITSNEQLVLAVRKANPDAFIVFKPHPDVTSGNRRGRLNMAAIDGAADLIATTESAISCIEAADEIHTMTSQTGFEGLLRGKRVVTYGLPFYAGWGLTDDRAMHAPALARRRRPLTLDELVAITLLHYPLYWDPAAGQLTDCEDTLSWLALNRHSMELTGRLVQLRKGGVSRLKRKLAVVVPSLFARL